MPACYVNAVPKDPLVLESQAVVSLPSVDTGTEHGFPVVAAGSSPLSFLSNPSGMVWVKLIPESLCSGRPQDGSAGRWWYLDFRSWGCCVQKGVTWFLWGPGTVSVAQVVKRSPTSCLVHSCYESTQPHHYDAICPGVILEPLWSGTVPWAFITMS